MKVLTQNYKTGQLELTEVPVPTIKQGHLLVRTIASAVSIGTERAMIELAQKSLIGKAIARPDWVAQVTKKIKTIYKVHERINRNANYDVIIFLSYHKTFEKIFKSLSVHKNKILDPFNYYSCFS